MNNRFSENSMWARGCVILLSFVGIASARAQDTDGAWNVVQQRGYKLLSRNIDKSSRQEYAVLFDNGIQAVGKFFGDSYKSQFDIAVHPNRQSLDRQWQKDWKMPDFKSECWMVASGVAHRLDLISPKRWDSESCEHKYSDTRKTQQLITHELFHVYHGQRNPSPDFSDFEGLDWFAEGLATYASGQCDSARMAEVKSALSAGKTPRGLDGFWTGQLRYGLSGSMVSFIDERYGRSKLKELLKYNTRRNVIEALGTTETELLSGWATYVRQYRLK